MINLEEAKLVETKDLSGNLNGHLLEIGKDGDRTTVYMTVANPGCFKGYHLHKVREANYVCISGRCVIEMATNNGMRIVELDSRRPQRLHIPVDTPTGLRNPFVEPAIIINVPNPAYDPSLEGEQVDFTYDQVVEWMNG
jgi:hypothetical protein